MANNISLYAYSTFCLSSHQFSTLFFQLHFVAVRGLSVVVVSGSYSLVVVCRLLIVVASLVEEYRLSSCAIRT